MLAEVELSVVVTVSLRALKKENRGERPPIKSAAAYLTVGLMGQALSHNARPCGYSSGATLAIILVPGTRY